MKCILICDEGFETIVSADLKEKFNISSTKLDKTIVEFEIGETEADYKKVAEIAYTLQSAIKILTHVKSCNSKEKLEEIEPEVISAAKIFEQDFNLKPETIKFNCTRKGEHQFKSVNITEILSKTIFTDIKRDYKNSNFEVLCYIKDEKGYIGLDFTQRILFKRDYRIFLGSSTLRSTIAYNLLKYAKYNQKEVIIDPFMGSGTIPIEAALLASKTSPFYFSKEKFAFTKILPKIDWDSWFDEIDKRRVDDKKEIYGFDSLLKFLKHTQKNAKIANINKILNLSKVEIDWIDTKVEEKSVDKIITHPPLYTEKGSTTKIKKVYNDMFNRCSEILKKKGKIILINTPKSIEVIEEIAKKYDYKLEDKTEVFEGQEKLCLITYAKQ